jgi:aminopeptidase YwaD
MKARAGIAPVALAAVCLLGCLAADTERPHLEANLEAHVAYLASDELEGRLVGTPGIEKAGAYVARRFKEIGLEPAFEESYFQDFELELGFELEGEPALRIGDAELAYPGAFSVLPFSGSGTVRGPAAVATDSDSTGRGAVLFTLIEPGIEEARWTMTGRDGLLEGMQATCARASDLGAAAVVFVAGNPEDPGAYLHRFALSRKYRAVDIPAFEVTYGVLRQALVSQGIQSENLVETMETQGLAGIGGAPLECAVEASVAPRTIKVRNVGGILRGDGPEYIVIGGHYDHLGYGDIASSTPWRREIHYGADDNASGVAGVIEIARSLASYGRPERSAVFLAFTAEELGALGSEYYCKNAPYPIDSTVTMINLDVVGRLEDGKLIAFGARSAEEFSRLLEEAAEGHDLEVIEKEEIYGFSDQNPFYARGVPALHFFTGAHDDYHSPDDTADKINFEGLKSLTSFVADFAGLIVFNPTDLTPLVVERETPVASSHGKGAHLGIIPDFAYAGTAVGIKGTVPGSPAEQAGLRDGDVIVGIDSQSIVDLRGLMVFLAGKNPGDSIEIHLMRGPIVESVGAILSVRSPRGQSD